LHRTFLITVRGVVKIRIFSKLLLVALLAFLVLGASFNSERCVSGQTNQTSTSLQAAESALDQAFSSVLNAEKAGGNVSQLLVKLNNAGTLLAEAQNAYNSGNPSNVTSMAQNVVQRANQVNGDAIHLRNVSLVESQNGFLLTLVFSVVGGGVFGISLLFVWRRFKCAFIKKLLGTKPEVVENST
jgi:Tfp pilus assembly protein PilX